MIEGDIKFLSENNLMDYSILIGIEEAKNFTNFNRVFAKFAGALNQSF